MKKLLIAILSAGLLVGCGADEAELAHEREMEKLKLQLDYQVELKKQEVAAVAAANQKSHTYIENEYETEVQQVPSQQYEAEQSYSSGNDGDYYSDSTGGSDADSSDSGSSAGDVLLGAAAGVAGAYLVSELLDNGMSSYTDNHGRTVYIDTKSGKEISKQQYDTAKKTSKVTQVKQKAKDLGVKAKAGAITAGQKTKELATKGVTKAKQFGQKVNNDPRFQKAKTKAVKVKDSAVSKTKQAVQKVSNYSKHNKSKKRRK